MRTFAALVLVACSAKETPAVPPTCADMSAAHLARPPPTYSARVVATASRYRGVYAAIIDVTGDARDDVVLITHDFERRRVGEVKIFRNDGGGKVSDLTADAGPTGFVPDGARRVITADVDGDGLKDIVLAQTGFDQGCDVPGSCPGAPDVLLLQADGRLADSGARWLHPYETNGFSHAGAVGDVDGDGQLDFFEARWPNSAASAQTHLQMQRGAAFAAEDDRLPADLTGPGQKAYASALFCDLDRDGAPELVLGNVDVAAANRVLHNDGAGHFSDAAGPFPASFATANGEYVLDLACVDYDGDGWNDLGVLSGGLNAPLINRFTLLHNATDGSFRDATPAQTFGSAPTYFQLWARDLNCDGWPDFLISGSPSEVPRMFTNDGASGFTEMLWPTALATDLRGVWIYPIDVDGDGRISFFAPRGVFEHYFVTPDDL
jgi:hypothetical protein